MQGFGKVFTYGMDTVYNSFFKESFQDSILPEFVVYATAYYTSFVELICGLLLTLGIFRHYAAYFLLLDLVIVTFGHGLMEPIWNMHHVFVRSALLICCLLLPNSWDTFNLDSLLKRK